MGSHADAVTALGRSQPAARKYFQPMFVKEKVQFVSKQPGSVKVTIRLLKWWRDQQEWSCALTRPSDEILEAIAIYSAQQSKPKTQAQAIANCMSLMSRFDSLRIMWTAHYQRDDVWAPLFIQRPLLMDPVNPFCNLADPKKFDARDLMCM